MLNKTSAAEARKKFANIINRVSYGKESFVLTRRGETLPAIVSLEDLKLLQEIEEQEEAALSRQSTANARGDLPVRARRQANRNRVRLVWWDECTAFAGESKCTSKS